MKSKKCIGCGEVLPLSLFFQCSAVKDGRKGKCKECMSLKQKERLQNPEVRSKRIAYSKKWNRNNRDYFNEYKKLDKSKEQERMRLKTPINKTKRKARDIINGAVRYKKVEKQPCKVCGHKIVEAHHSDYSNPLNVDWLCLKHHQEEHYGIV